MRRAWVDSSFWYAYTYRDEPAHHDVVALMSVPDVELITSTFTLGETASLITKRGSKLHAIRLVRLIDREDRCSVIHPTEAQIASAQHLFLSYPDWDFDLVDAISFALMREMTIQNALTLDRHFAQMGFITLPD